MDYIQQQQINTYELYNLEEDPGQKHDLADKYPDVVDRMSAHMQALREETIREGGDWFQENQ